MKVYLSPHELIHVYQTVMSSPMQSQEEQTSLVTRLNSIIIDSLERVEQEDSKKAFKVWASKEQDRIESLSSENESLKSKSQPPRGRKR